MGDPSTEACQLNCGVVKFIDDTVCVGNCTLSVLEVFTNYVVFFQFFLQDSCHHHFTKPKRIESIYLFIEWTMLSSSGFG